MEENTPKEVKITRKENVPCGTKPKYPRKSQSVAQECKSWDLTGKLRKVTVELKEIERKVKNLEDEVCKFTREIESENQMIEKIQLLMPDENSLIEREAMMMQEQLNMDELQVFQKEKEIDALLCHYKDMKLKEEKLENTANEFKEHMYFFNQSISIKDEEIQRVKSDTKEIENELRLVMDEYHLNKSLLESLSLEVKILEDCVKSMENGNITAHKKLKKHYLKI